MLKSRANTALQIPDCGLLCDLLWSDPDKEITGWSENDRGVSFTFGPDVVSRFLQKHDMDLICRAHQVVEDGYEFFSKRQLVTLFSAPNYCGEFDNAGAMMSVDESLLCSFQVCTQCRFGGIDANVFFRSLNPRRRNRNTFTAEWARAGRSLLPGNRRRSKRLCSGLPFFRWFGPRTSVWMKLICGLVSFS